LGSGPREPFAVRPVAVDARGWPVTSSLVRDDGRCREVRRVLIEARGFRIGWLIRSAALELTPQFSE
jgi:16S rRNA U516 pseudouridylate synthase RsuA-like enzyme